MEERGSPFGEPCFLWVGRAEIYIFNDWNGIVSLFCRDSDWKLWKKQNREKNPGDIGGNQHWSSDFL